MKKTKKILSFVLAALMIMSLAVESLALVVSAADTNDLIQSFRASFVSGASKNADEDYVWTPDGTDAHMFKYRVSYSLSGEGEFAEETVEIRIPKSILTDRDGNRADTYDVSVPEDTTADLPDTAIFVYKEDSDDIVIYNRLPVPKAWAGYFDIGYVMSEPVFRYVDYGAEGSASAPFEAAIKVTKGTDVETDEAEAPEVYVDTTAYVKSTKKEQKGNLIEVWDSTWGTAPADAGDYYYLIWTITTEVAATQPYDFAIEDIFDEDSKFFDDDETEIVGYKLSGESGFSDKNVQTGLTDVGVRYDYVLTRHSKAKHAELVKDNGDALARKSYTLKNSITATVTPVDKIDNATAKDGKTTFTFEQKVWTRPVGDLNYHVVGVLTGPLPAGNSISCADTVLNCEANSKFMSSYALSEFLQGKADGGEDEMTDLRFYSYAEGRPYPWTMAEGADPDDPASYGQVPVHIFIENYEYCLPEDVVLTAEDYEIRSIVPKYRVYTAAYNNEDKIFKATAKTFGPEDYLKIYLKIDGADEPVLAAVWHMDTQTYSDVNSTYVSGSNGSELLLKPDLGITGYALETDTTAYSFEYGAIANLTLFRNDNVVDTIKDANPDYEEQGARTRLTENGVCCYTRTDGVTVYDGEPIYDFGDDYIMGIERTGTIKKTVLSYKNDKVNRIFTTKWKVNVEESYHDVDSSIQYVPQDGGVFYDLLPEGSSCDPSTVEVYGDNVKLLPGNYTTELIENYQGSGRTMLIIRVNSTANKYYFTYSSVISWDSIKDYGEAFTNTVAYETGNVNIGGGLPDLGGFDDKGKNKAKLTYSDLMKGLDEDAGTAKRFLFAQYKYKPSLVTSGNIGLYKKVAGPGSVVYADKAVTYINSTYSYQLRFATDLSEQAKSLILFDSLENFTSDTIEGSDWRGTLAGLDLSQLKKLGIAPVVYYSAVEKLDIEDNCDLTDGTVWLEETAFFAAGNTLADVRAFAVDMSKKADGSDYVMPADASAGVRVFMNAPAESPEVGHIPAAYNNVYLALAHAAADEDVTLVRQDYTTVELLVVGDVDLKKVASDDKRPISGTVFRLYGTSGYGNAIDLTAVSVNGSVVFDDVEMGTYRLEEISTTDDYFLNETVWEVVIDSKGVTTVEEKTGVFEIENDPRIHGDLVIAKKGTVDGKEGTLTALPGTFFRLEGVSDYGNNVRMDVVTDNAGKASFLNIEMGRYTLTEVAPAEGYQLGEVSEWTVIVDAAGNAYVLDDTLTVDRGVTQIINEPLHEFSFFKLNAANRTKVVEGAKFNLNGISDKGTVFDLNAVSDASGVVSFTDLEAGTYTLTETKAPENYKLDPTPYTITIGTDGTVTGLEKLSAYWTDVTGFENYFAVLNEPEYNGQITVIKKWIDQESDIPNRPIPVVHISTEEPEFNKPYATFDRDLWVSFKGLYSDTLAGQPTSTLKEVRRSYDAAHPANAVKVDDGETDYSIYAWCDEEAQIIYWWTDAVVAFLPEIADHMFSGLSDCTFIDLTGISSARTTDMRYFFSNDECLTRVDLSGLDTSKVENMDHMFGGCVHICEAVSDWSILDTSSCTNMEYMFHSVEADEMDISSFDVSKVTNTYRMFQSSKIKKLVMTDMDWSGMTDGAGMAYMFYSCDPEMTVDMTGSDFSKMSSLMGQDLNTSKQMSPFSKSNVKELILKDCDFSGVTRLESSYNDRTGPFMEMLYLTKLDLSGANFASLTSMGNLFNVNFTSTEYSKRTRNLEWFSMEGAYTPKLEHLNSTFYVCDKLAYVNLAGIDGTHVKNLASTFCGCKALETIDFTGTTFTSLLYLSSLFEGCKMLSSVDLSKFDTSGVTTMENMFWGCNALTELDLSIFDTSSVTKFDSMFKNCTNLKTIRVSDGWTVSGSATGGSMFDGCSALVGEKGTSYDVHHVIGKTYAHVDGGTDDPGYLTYKAAVPFTPYVPEAPVKPEDPDTPDTPVDPVEPEYEPWLMLLPGTLWGYNEETGEGFQIEGGFNDLFKNYFFTATAFRMGDALPADGVTKYDFTDTENSDPDTHIWLWQDGDTVYWYPEGADPYITYDLGNMFAGCTNLKSIDLTGFRGTYTSFVDGNEYPMVEYAAYMFEGCTSLEEVNFGGLTFGGFVDEYEDRCGCGEVEGMFFGCTSLKHADLSGLTMECVWNTMSMFEGCTSLIDVKMPDFAPIDFGVTEGMFAGCSSLETIYVSELWQMSEDSDGIDMFDGCVKLVGQNGTAYSADHTDFEYARIDESGTPGYFTYMEPTVEPADPVVPIDPKTKTYDSVSEMGVEGDLEKWIDNGDGTWSYTFRVFDENNTYYVWEDDVPTYIGDITVLNPEKIQYVEKKGAPVVTITNEKEYEDGGLILRKLVEGTLTREEMEKEFTFTVTLGDTTVNGWYGDAEFKNGVATVSLKAGESVSISGLPDNLTYSITETVPDGFDVTYENATGTVKASKVVTVIAINTKIIPNVGSLTVEKKLESGESAAAFPFTITLTDGDGNPVSGTFGGFTFVNGVLSFTLKAGDKITVTDIPAGTFYAVTETVTDGFVKVSESNCSGTIVQSETAEAVITNKPVEKFYGGFTVEKKLNGFTSDEKFTVNVVLSGLEPGKTYTLSDNSTFTATAAGTATVTLSLKGGDSVKFTGLPVDTVFTVSEPACAYTASYTVTENGNVIESGANTEANVTISTKSQTVVKDGDPVVTITNAPALHLFSFGKANPQGDLIPGALMQIVADGSVIHEWTSATEMTELELAAGTYRLHEEEAPSDDYMLADDIFFKVVTDGTLLISDDNGETYAEAEAALIVMTDFYNITIIPNIKPDVVVIDYGLPVSINVLDNDDLSTGASVIGISKTEPAKIAGSDRYAPTDTPDAAFASKTFKGAFGTAEIKDNGIVYSINTMSMDAAETFWYCAADTDATTGKTMYYYEKVTVVPATIIYYEDSELFMEFDENWEGEDQTGTQSEDRPAFLNDNDADNVYGFDPAYENCATYSLGGARKATVDAETAATMSFTFTGTGFDLISRTDKTTGAFLVRVNGQNTGSSYSWIVDTYYGFSKVTQDGWVQYNWTLHEDGLWYAEKVDTIVTTEPTSDPVPTDPQPGDTFTSYEKHYTWTAGDQGSLYQIPVIKSGDLGYDTYTVTVTALYHELFEHGQTSDGGSYDLYLDAIRIYNPAQGNADCEAVYTKDHEADPEFFEIRNLLIKAEDFTAGQTEVGGIAFLDAFGTEYTLADFIAFGPNNEVYLQAGQAIAFYVEGDNIDKIHVSGKALVEPTDTETTKMTVNGHEYALKTGTDLYYDITPETIDGKTLVVIRNSGSNILSLTNIKVTHKEAPALLKSAVRFFATPAMVQSVSRSLTTTYVAQHTASTFAPAALKVKTSKNTLKRGDALNVTVTTSADVASVTVNGLKANLVCTDKRTGEKVWSFTANALMSGSFDAKVVVTNANGTAADAIVKSVKVLDNGQMNGLKGAMRAISGRFTAVQLSENAF